MSHVIFIGNPGYERFDYYTKPNLLRRFISHVASTVKDLPRRIALSFVPPFVTSSAKKVYVDLVGPSLAVTILTILLHIGHAVKDPGSAMLIMPSVMIFLYSAFTPIVCYIVACASGAKCTICDLIALLGYGLFGHVLTLLICFVLEDNTSTNFVFFTCLIIFGGLTSLRIVLILLVTIPKPAARLIVCSFVTLVHLLFLIFVHFSYMHRTFSYGKSTSLMI